MDNTLSFSQFTRGHENNLRPLLRIAGVPARARRTLRALTLESIESGARRSAMTTAGLGPLLTDEEIRAILARRDNVLAYIDRLIAQYGEDAVLALP